MLYDTKWDKQVKSSPVRDCLIEGRKLVERGWCQGAFQKGERVCILGSFIDDVEMSRQALRAIASAIGRPGADACAVVRWNDHKGRTQEEVLAAFDRAIAAS